MIFKALHASMDSVPSLSAEQIIEKIGNHNFVSFDVFDTVIRRMAPSAEDVFLIVGQRMGLESPTLFQRDRIEAGKTARKTAFTDGRSETTIGEIYALMPERYRTMSADLIALEERTEEDLCVPDPVLQKVYDWCVQCGKQVLFATDIYLPRLTIETILAKCGYSEYRALLVSSELCATKRSGGLYVELLREIPPGERAIHIGDHYKSDFLIPRRFGMDAVKLAKYPSRAEFSGGIRLHGEDSLNYKRLTSLINCHLNPEENFFYKYGFECLGPLLAGAAKHLHDVFASGHYDKVFFLSRDGYMLKNVYEAAYPDETANSRYLYVSRKSVQFPLLCGFNDIEEYFKLNGTKKIWNWRTFSNRLTLDLEEASEVWKRFGLPLGYRFMASQISSDRRITAFYEHFKNDIKMKSEREAELLKAYLKSQGFEGKVLIADTGGYGTTQKCLEIFSEWNHLNVSMTGAYLWLYGNPSFKAFAFPFPCNTSHGGETLITELPMTAHEGTVEGYVRTNDNQIKPLLGAYEYDAYPEMRDAIQNIQAGAMQFASIFRHCEGLDFLSQSVAYANMKRVSQSPSLRQARNLGDFLFLSDHQESYLAKPKSAFQYFKDVKALRNDFLSADWKIGFLKRLLKAPLPYYSLIAWGRDFFEHFQ